MKAPVLDASNPSHHHKGPNDATTGRREDRQKWTLNTDEWWGGEVYTKEEEAGCPSSSVPLTEENTMRREGSKGEKNSTQNSLVYKRQGSEKILHLLSAIPVLIFDPLESSRESSLPLPDNNGRRMHHGVHKKETGRGEDQIKNRSIKTFLFASGITASDHSPAPCFALSSNTEIRQDTGISWQHTLT